MTNEFPFVLSDMARKRRSGAQRRRRAAIRKTEEAMLLSDHPWAGVCRFEYRGDLFVPIYVDDKPRPTASLLVSTAHGPMVDPTPPPRLQNGGGAPTHVTRDYWGRRVEFYRPSYYHGSAVYPTRHFHSPQPPVQRGA